MTFYEAAVEVLRRTGRPLHYKKITEIAVRENLLSHVGKTPDKTMSDRLEKEVKKNDGSVIDQQRPGVFQLHDEDGAAELIERIKEKQEARQKRARNKDESGGTNDTRQRDDSRQQQQRDDGGGGGGGSDSGSDDRKRRRSRGSKSQAVKKKRKRDEDDSSTKARKRKRTRSDSGGQDQDQGQDHDRNRGGQKQKQDESGGGDDNKRRRRRRRRSDDDSSGDTGRSTDAPSVSVSKQTHLEEGPVRLEGIPKAAYKVLDQNGGGAVPIDELAEKIFDQKLVKFHTHDEVTTVKSALANDNQIRADRGHRPLFDHDDRGNWWLTKRHLSSAVYEKEQAILSLTEEVRQQSMEQLGDLLEDIRAEALEYLALTLLERLGYYNIKVSKRSSEGDVFFTADWRQGLADVRVCVRVVTDSDRTLQDSAVEDLRETLDHYSASEGVVIHLGDVADGAIDRARVNGQAPITLLDRETFVELLVKHGIGVRTFQSPLVMVDSEFIDALAD